MFDAVPLPGLIWSWKTKGRIFPGELAALINTINKYNYHRERLKRDRRDKSKSPRGTRMNTGISMFNPGSSSHDPDAFPSSKCPIFILDLLICVGRS